jgi:plastocyanin
MGPPAASGGVDPMIRGQGGTIPMKQSIVGSVVAVAAFAAGLGLFFSGLPVSAQGGGSISGEVKFTGAAPAPKVVKVNKDNQVCGEEKKIVEVAVGPGGGLAEALVSVTDAKGAKPSKPAVLDQKGCEFHPDVVVMAPGELKILNSDGVLHNIHTFSTANPPINKAQPKFKKEMTEKLEKPELVKVQCDAHSWMHGWIFVTENPTAVTDANGAFKLENVPPGKHKVEVIHPVLGKQTKEVEVKAGQDTKVVFELKK